MGRVWVLTCNWPFISNVVRDIFPADFSCYILTWLWKFADVLVLYSETWDLSVKLEKQL